MGLPSSDGILCVSLLNGENTLNTFFRKMATLLQSRRFMLTLLFIVFSIVAPNTVVSEREAHATQATEAILALWPLFGTLAAFVTLLVSYALRPTTGKAFFDSLVNPEIVSKLAELISIVKEAQKPEA